MEFWRSVVVSAVLVSVMVVPGVADQKEKPVLTAEEMVRIERVNYVTHIQELEAEIAKLKADKIREAVAREVAELREQLKVKYPDWEWNPTTGAFTQKATSQDTDKPKEPGDGDLR